MESHCNVVQLYSHVSLLGPMTAGGMAGFHKESKIVLATELYAYVLFKLLAEI